MMGELRSGALGSKTPLSDRHFMESPGIPKGCSEFTEHLLGR